VLVPEWKKFPRMLSMQAMGAATALQLTWQNLPDDMRAAMPHQVLTGCTVALLVLGMVGRLVKQPNVSEDDA